MKLNTAIAILSTVSCGLASASSSLNQHLLVKFTGKVSGKSYVLGAGEIDTTRSFQFNGSPVLQRDSLLLSGSGDQDDEADGCYFNPDKLGKLVSMNWVAETVVTFNSYGGFSTVIDVQGDTEFRVSQQGHSLEATYWDGDESLHVNVGFPPAGSRMHLALVWDAAKTCLTAYIDGVSVGQMDQKAFDVADATKVGFGYMAREGYVGRGVDGKLDAVAFSTFSGSFDVSKDLQLFEAKEKSPPQVLIGIGNFSLILEGKQ